MLADYPGLQSPDSLSRSLCSGCVHSNQFVPNSDVRDMHIPDSDFGTDSVTSGGVRAKPFPVVLGHPVAYKRRLALNDHGDRHSPPLA